jgi:galactose mutarotase-like enzyme
MCRISGAKFTLDGQEYKLAANEGTSSIHGGAVSAASRSRGQEQVQGPGTGPGAQYAYLVILRREKP